MLGRKLLFLTLFVLFSSVALAEQEEPVEIVFFFSQHCKACHSVKVKTIPRIELKYADKIKIEKLNVDESQNLLRILDLQQQYDSDPKKDLVPTIAIDGKFLVGFEDIDKYVDMEINSVLSKKGDVSVARFTTNPTDDLITIFKRFSPLVVFAAGLIDGVNPCAFTAIIFFISFLALQGYGKRQILIIGLTFIAAVFLTYILIGLGLFSFIYNLRGYWWVVKGVYFSGAVLCFALAGFALWDFIKFRRTQQTQDLVLQLPKNLKQKIHNIIGRFYRKDRVKVAAKTEGTLGLVISAFIVGCFVSLFEGVCTGQIYLPTIVFVFKATEFKLQALFYLLLYNLMFVFPLVLILMFALWGVESKDFARLAQRHMGLIKILMMVLFLSLGILLFLGGL